MRFDLSKVTNGAFENAKSPQSGSPSWTGPKPASPAGIAPSRQKTTGWDYLRQATRPAT